MSGASTTFTTARFLTPDYIVQGAEHDLSCPLWRDGAIIEVDSGTVSIFDAGNVAIVTAAAVTVDGDGVPNYTLAGATTSSKPRGMGWRVEWTLTSAEGTKTYRNSAGLVKCELAPVITDDDLYGLESALDPDGGAPVSTLTTYQPFIDAAWVILHGRLVGKGNLPNRIMEPSALREPHMLLTLHLVFNDFRTRLNETWKEKAEEYKLGWKEAYDGLAVEYDTTDAGASDGRRKRSMSPTVWLMGSD